MKWKLLVFPYLLRFSALLLCGTLLLPTFAGCENKEPAETTSDSGTEATGKPAVLVSEGEAHYSFRADKTVVEDCRDSIDFVNRALTTRLGAPLPVNDTSKEHSVSLVLSGGDNDYSISVDAATKDVTVTAGTSYVLRHALGVFASIILSGEADGVPCENWNHSYIYNADKINNSSLLSYIPSDQVKLSPSNKAGTVLSPDWVDSLVMVEVRLQTASIGGKLDQSRDLIDFYAACGVNCLWIAPVYEPGSGGNGYGNNGPHTIDPALTGTKDYEEGWKKLRSFIDYAHSKGIYILLDIITWGTVKGSPLVKEHPDWFDGEAWGNAAFNWKNPEFVEWFTGTAVDNILTTDADGYRCDCEPNYSGYRVYADVRARLAEQGKYIMIMSEDGNNRSAAYDMEQDGVLDYSVCDRAGFFFEKKINFFADGILDMVSATKKGKGIGSRSEQVRPANAGSAKYYTNGICNHDFQYRIVKGNRLNIGYAAIYAPYIPLWYMGDEFNASNRDATLYDQTVNWNDAYTPANTLFLEDVKKMLQIRRTYSDIFEYWPDDHRKTNIALVKAEGKNTLQSYARYAGNRAVLIIPNNAEKGDGVTEVTLPYAACGLESYSDFRLTDLLTGKTVAEGKKETLTTVTVTVPFRYMGVYLLEGLSDTVK